MTTPLREFISELREFTQSESNDDLILGFVAPLVAQLAVSETWQTLPSFDQRSTTVRVFTRCTKSLITRSSCER